MKFFTRSELVGVISILLVLAVVSAFNFSQSIKRARDNQRKNDVGSVASSLEKYHADLGVFPPSSEDGKIVACKGSETKFDPLTKTWINLVACEWGKDALINLADESFAPYASILPTDPLEQKGFAFRYVSNGSRFQLFAALEDKKDAEYNSQIEVRKLMCGNYLCNFGKAFSKTPLEISLEDYEQQLKEKE